MKPTTLVRIPNSTPKRRSIGKIIGRIALLLLVILLAVVIGFAIWARSATPMEEALPALQSDAAVNVDSSRWYEFTPVDANPVVGLIFYPGGRVEPRSYAPFMRQIAEAGYYAVIVPMPLNHAVFSPNKAAEVIAAHPEITKWVIGGHSLGGAMAALYTDSHSDQIDGLVLWASYPADANSLADQPDLAVASIYGTMDGLISQNDIDQSKPLLPTSAQFVPIEGGNHAQFGWYGNQAGDSMATISRDEQMARTVAATVAVLEKVAK